MIDKPDVRSREEGESPYDYCLFLIDAGRLKRAEKWIEHGRVEERALHKILQDQIAFVRRIKKALKKEQLEKAERLRHCIISPATRKQFKESIAALKEVGAGKKEEADQREAIEPTVSIANPVAKEGEKVPSLARGLLLKKLEEKAGNYSEDTLDEVTRMIEQTWLRERAGKHSIGIGRVDLLVVLECLSSRNGSPITLETLMERLDRSKSQIKESVRDLQRNYLRGSGFTFEGDIDADGVRLVRSSVEDPE